MMKLFKDPVHGYIEVDERFCKAFVDTDVFQRLRFVEQSSMRMLFPGARHDRFIHSLGVYSIARRLFAAFMPELEKSVKGQELERVKHTFLAAALLHDCAHSPFSHTGEILAESYCYEDIVTNLKDVVASQEFNADFYSDEENVHYATHEMASAYVGCKRYQDAFANLGIDQEQFARMIIGVKNKRNVDGIRRVYNCLIPLINGFVVDVDRLDYLERDTWATGIRNASVDMDRLISGIEPDFVKGRLRILHKALSCVYNAVMARDYFYQWVIPHHKVAYANEILVRSMGRLIKILATKWKCAETEVGETLLSPNRLLPNGRIERCGDVIYMPNDGDILYLMKKYMPEDSLFQAYYSRKRAHISLWKNHAEFMHHFSSDTQYKTALGKSAFWDRFYGNLNETFRDDDDVLYTKPREVKVTKCEILKLDVYARGATDGEQCKLDLTYMREGVEQKNYYMNAYVSIFAKDRIPEFRKKFRSCFETCLDAYVHGE